MTVVHVSLVMDARAPNGVRLSAPERIKTGHLWPPSMHPDNSLGEYGAKVEGTMRFYLEIAIVKVFVLVKHKHRKCDSKEMEAFQRNDFVC